MEHRPDRVVLHHAGVLWKHGDRSRSKIRALQSWGQREKGWPDLPYHFLLDPEGTIYEGREMRFRPESNTQYDLTGAINVHLWGDFDQQRVSLPQLRSTVELLAWLADQWQLQKVTTHCQEAPGQTTCPGYDLLRYLDSGTLQDWVQQQRAGASPVVECFP